MEGKKFLFETKNISDEVILVGNEITRAICRDYKSRQKLFSKVNKLPYVEGNFVFNVDNLYPTINGVCYNRFGMNEINVNYAMYFFRDDRDVDMLIGGDGGLSDSSSSDFDEKRLTIVSGFMYGKLYNDFMRNMYHEVNHLFEYANGMEKKVDLYDSAIELVKNGKTNLEKSIGILVYMSFPHEIDAFVHEFYGVLIQNGTPSSFEELLKYTEYQYCINLINTFNLKHFDNEKWRIVNGIGLTWKQFSKRVHFGMKKMRRKMFNAFKRYRMEYVGKNTTVETIIRSELKNAILLEEWSKKYPGIEYGIETIYIF